MILNKHQFSLDFIIGGISAGIGKTATAPIDRVKILLQTQNANISIIKNKKNYTGIINCFYRVYKETGLLSFWRGNSVNLLRYMPTQACNFAFKNFYKKMLSKKNIKINFFLKNLLSGGLAGTTSCLILYPLDFIRTRLATDVGKDKKNREFKNLSDCIKKIYKKEGMKGYYKGMAIALPSIFVYRSLFFGLYDSGKNYSFFENKISKFFFALSVTSFASSFLYPLDTVKRSMMLQVGKNNNEKIYNNYKDCFIDIWRKEKIFGFYRGGLTNVFRGMGASIFLVLNDFFKKNIKK